MTARPIRWYRLDGTTPVPLETDEEQIAEWRRRELGLAAGEDPYRVARTELDGGRFVSTVFLGLDHEWRTGEPPLLFETMVFPECDVVERCWTWEQAVAQHERVVSEVGS